MIVSHHKQNNPNVQKVNKFKGAITLMSHCIYRERTKCKLLLNDTNCIFALTWLLLRRTCCFMSCHSHRQNWIQSQKYCSLHVLRSSKSTSDVYCSLWFVCTVWWSAPNMSHLSQTWNISLRKSCLMLVYRCCQCHRRASAQLLHSDWLLEEEGRC